MFSQLHHNLTPIISRQILKSLIGSLNATAIAYARGHLRFNAMENIAARKGKDEVPTIDDFNDAQAAIDESKFRNDVVAPSMGFATQMPSGDLAGNLMMLREFCAAQLEQLKVAATDVPLSIAETVKFQMDRQPDVNDARIEALAEAVEMDADTLKAANLQMIADDAADLRANAGKIITFLDKFGSVQLNEGEIESLFDKLPAHVQLKLVYAGVRAHDSATKKAMMALLRGKLDAAGDIRLIKAHREELMTWLRTFSIVKRAELDDYIERGGMLPDVDNTLVTSNAPKTEAVASIPKSQMAPIGSCEVKHVTTVSGQSVEVNQPKSIGKARRAPAPMQ